MQRSTGRDHIHDGLDLAQQRLAREGQKVGRIHLDHVCRRAGAWHGDLVAGCRRHLALVLQAPERGVCRARILGIAIGTKPELAGGDAGSRPEQRDRHVELAVQAGVAARFEVRVFGV